MHHHPLRHDCFRLSECAVCTQGYGRSLGNTCHYCDDTSAHLLIAAATIFCFLTIPLILIAVVFLIGGLDAVNVGRQFVIHKLSLARKAIRNDGHLVPETYWLERNHTEDGTSINAWDGTIPPGNRNALEVTYRGVRITAGYCRLNSLRETSLKWHGIGLYPSCSGWNRVTALDRSFCVRHDCCQCIRSRFC